MASLQGFSCTCLEWLALQKVGERSQRVDVKRAGSGALTLPWPEATWQEKVYVFILCCRSDVPHIYAIRSKSGLGCVSYKPCCRSVSPLGSFPSEKLRQRKHFLLLLPWWLQRRETARRTSWLWWNTCIGQSHGLQSREKSVSGQLAKLLCFGFGFWCLFVCLNSWSFKILLSLFQVSPRRESLESWVQCWCH